LAFAFCIPGSRVCHIGEIQDLDHCVFSINIAVFIVNSALPLCRDNLVLDLSTMHFGADVGTREEVTLTNLAWRINAMVSA
jgi:hypothetical protein